MSRTYKLHTHIAPGDGYLNSSNKAKKSNYRSQVKVELNKTSDPDDIVVPDEKEFTSKKRSSGYIDPLETEESVLKEYMSYKQTLINGGDIKVFWTLTGIEKIIIEAEVQKTPDFPGFTEIGSTKSPDFYNNKQKNLEEHLYYWKKGLVELSEEELKECIHKYFASKGYKK